MLHISSCLTVNPFDNTGVSGNDSGAGSTVTTTRGTGEYCCRPTVPGLASQRLDLGRNKRVCKKLITAIVQSQHVLEQQHVLSPYDVNLPLFIYFTYPKFLTANVVQQLQFIYV